MATVTYIPPQTIDESQFTSNRASVSDPLNLFFHDALILFKSLKYILNVLFPLRIPIHRHGVRYHLAPIAANETLLALTIAYEVVLLFVAPVAIFILPGWAFIAFFLVTTAIVVLLAAPGWGPWTVQSQNCCVPPNKFPREKWIFMNGVAQSHLDLQFTIDNLAATFGRPFLGIHNRSYGFVWDIGECLIQRCFGYSSKDVRVCYDELRKPLLDPSITKVIVIAHSQGGIILSLTIDRMFAELPAASMSKLEIYTFGSAAAHFNNPLKICSHIDQTLRSKDLHQKGSPQDYHHRQRRRHRREEQLPPPRKTVSEPQLPGVATQPSQTPRIFEQPTVRSPLESPALDHAIEKPEKAIFAGLGNQSQQGPSIIAQPTINDPLIQYPSDLYVEKTKSTTVPDVSSRLQPTASILEQTTVMDPSETALDPNVGEIGNLTIPESVNEDQLLAANEETLQVSDQYRPSLPRLAVGGLAEAVVDIANAASRSFFWRSSSESSDKEVQQSQVIDRNYAKELSREQSGGVSLVSPRNGAFDGTHNDSSPLHHPHDKASGYVNEGGKHIIPVIEHYCNELDMVPRWGVLNDICHQPELRYAGSVFIQRKTSGHLFNRHYLDTMFPMDRKAQRFLNQVVDVDVGTAKARASALVYSIANAPHAEKESRSWLLYDSITELVSPSDVFAWILAVIIFVHLRLTALSGFNISSVRQTTRFMREGMTLMGKEKTAMAPDPIGEGASAEEVEALAGTVESANADADAAIEEGSGKTVKQLSKLWRYMYGQAA
ncbi:MAG: hypothetical protein M1821_001160 [Bathelium mastoideum]|nr:MAG: hypothetical protein M1821_001160 [Bathelium mastoideum]